MTVINFGNKTISNEGAPYIIAEIGVNHEGSMDRAKKLISLAKDGGADAVKFQTYKAESLASKNSPAYWDTKKEPTQNQYKLFKKYDSFGPNEFSELSKYSIKNGIDFLSTPFDNNAVDFLNPLVSCFKIASADITNIPLLRKIAKKNKPIFLSTGASSIDEIDSAIQELVKNGCKKKEIVVMHCILNYPTEKKNANLNMIKSLKQKYSDHLIGYSDHTLPDKNMSSLTSAFLLGATVIEKHFTDNKALVGNDHYHSMDVNDLINLKKLLKEFQILLGLFTEKKPIDSEKIARENARRSIVLKHDVKAGHRLVAEDITCKRPGTGVSPLHCDKILGYTVINNLNADHILQWKDLKKN